MFDSMWLNETSLQSIPTVIWSICAYEEDTCTIRLRQEIINMLHAPVTTQADQADIVLVVENKHCVNADLMQPWQIDESYSITVAAKPSNNTHDDHQAPHATICVRANTSVGLLHGFYALIRGLVTRTISFDCPCTITDAPRQSIRMIDQWDQIDGSVERGYAGESIFFGAMNSNSHADFRSFPPRDTTNPFRGDFERIEAYARFLASIGINAIALNNVNVRGAATELITQPFLSRVKQIAAILSSFGIRTFLSINFASPKRLGGMQTADPCDSEVQQWWTDIVDSIYATIPDFGGFVVKADSEGEPGPMQYGRTHADGANMLGRALAAHGGIVIWRAFVYNSKQDWRDRTTDRAKAAYENFVPLDGQFDDNVIIQVKFGPMDFQVREPLNPLIAAMRHTNMIVEYQITAEYLGHQIDINYVLPQWRSMALQHTTVHSVADDRVCSLIRSRSADVHNTGFAAVSNIGMDENWTGNSLAQLNLYAFGRMCWNPELTAQTIAREWVAQTFPHLELGERNTLEEILLSSNQTYENYTSPLGVGFMVTPAVHYGPAVDGYEFDRWGTYHFADRNGIGVDRTTASGSGYTSQYPTDLAEQYEHLESTPDELLLFFHHVPYTHTLHSGKTVIQHIYDTHFAGVERVQQYIQQWDALREHIPDSTWNNVADRLQQQLENARNWRDQVNTFFYRMSGIADEHNREIFA